MEKYRKENRTLSRKTVQVFYEPICGTGVPKFYINGEPKSILFLNDFCLILLRYFGITVSRIKDLMSVDCSRYGKIRTVSREITLLLVRNKRKLVRIFGPPKTRTTI